VTPLQLIRAYGAIANEGKTHDPYVVRRVVAADGRIQKENHPQVVGQPITPETAAMVTTLLRDVVEGVGPERRRVSMALRSRQNWHGTKSLI